MTKPLDRLRAARAVAIFRHPRPIDLVRFVECMVEAGWRAIEITSDTPGALAAVATVRRTMGDGLYLGIGTVHSAAVAREAMEAGASFVVSPVHVPEVVEAVRSSPALCVSGALTPTEIFRAWEDGADVVKVFPVSAMAGDYVGQIKGPFPHIPLLPTGTLDAERGRQLLAQGALAIGVGSAAIDYNAVEVQRWSWVREHAERFLRDLAEDA